MTTPLTETIIDDIHALEDYGLDMVMLFHSSMAARSAAPWFGSKSHSTASLDTFFDFPFHTINVAGVALVHTLARVYLLSVY